MLRIIELLDYSISKSFSRIKNAVDYALQGMLEENIVKDLSLNFYRLAETIKLMDENDSLYEKNILLLRLILSKKEQHKVHPSFISILKLITIDEMRILEDTNKNNYEFIATYDFEKGNGFYNHQWKRFDYPKNNLFVPEDFDFYITHLQDVLNVIQWPIYRQEAIREMGEQTGSVQYSKLILTNYGQKFISCFIKNENQPQG